MKGLFTIVILKTIGFGWIEKKLNKLYKLTIPQDQKAESYDGDVNDTHQI